MQYQFVCGEVRHYPGGSDVKLEKTSDAKDDPRGLVQLSGMDSELAQQFVAGKNYVVDFSPVTAA